MKPWRVSSTLVVQEQVAQLEAAHGQGGQTFEMAAQRALAFVASYPNRIFGKDLQHDDGRVTTAYEAALTGLSTAMNSDEVARDFAETIERRLAEAAERNVSIFPLSRRALPLMLEAVHTCFPEEIAMPNNPPGA